MGLGQAREKLRIEAVSKSYGDVKALRPSSLSVSAGEFLTLLGPSGSGKTTLLAILAGLAIPDEGQVWIDGERATHLPAHLRNIGVVFQNYALFPHLNVFENIAFPLRMQKKPMAEIREKVSRILEIVRLPDVAARLPSALSGGQQQRIAFARCAVYEPSIILMDEPLGALDKRLRDEMQEEIKRIHKEVGATIVYITHDQEEALAMSDRICLMNSGGIEQIGTPRQLYFEPASVFAANFLGDCNFIAEGQLIRPECLVLGEQTKACDNLRQATVTSLSLAGSITRFHLSLESGSAFTAVIATNRQSSSIRQGEVIPVGWDSDDVIRLPGAAR